MNLALDIAVRHISWRLRQTLVAMFGVATGVGFSIMMAGLMQGSQNDFINTLVNALPHITVNDELRTVEPQPAERVYDLAAIRGLKPRDDRRGIKNPYETVAILESTLGQGVAPYVSARGIIAVAGREFSVGILGLEPRRDRFVSRLATQMKQGVLEDLSTAANAVIVGDRLALKLGATLGTQVNLVASNGSTVQSRIVGIFHAGIQTLDEGQVYTLVRTAQVLLGRTGYINEIRIRTADPLAARAVSTVIEQRIPYRAVSWQEAQEDLLSSFQIRNIIMYTVVGAILLVASLGIYNIISTITHEKARDIAIMKSLGLRRAVVQRIFVIESFIIGLAGSMIGWAMGYGMCLLLGQVEIKTPFMDATHLPILYSWVHYALSTAIALTAAVSAGYMPSRKAAAANPVDIIRGAT